ncbi:SAXO1-like protein [Mya arenaria]|uniref:SAXO1-like protein n=1 Tax=Mya arenaria TaxID=6604 RepID=A0ABY7DWK5_MYAAR|nr:SAXO1-like protein [Mya arenaria]
MTKRCICQICTCGRHKCPHNPTNHLSQGDGPCRLTEYTNVYKAHPLGARENFKPNQQPMHGGEFMDKTTQRTDYKPHPLERPFVHKHEDYVKPPGDMENMTSYKQEYKSMHPQHKPLGMKARGNCQLDLRGNQHTNKWDGTRVQAYGQQAAWEPPKSKFEGQTTFQTDYRSKEIGPRHSFKPNEGAKMSDTPFEDRTSHRDAYIQHAMPARFQREREHYKPPQVGFEGLSTQKRDYKGAVGQPTHSFKPEGRAFQSEAPFDDDTTNRVDYKRWPMERPFVHAHDQYQKPAGEMDMNTTHNQTYREMPIERVVAMRPNSMKQASAPFDGTTNYNSDFRKWNGERAQMTKQPAYMPNNAPFEGNSTYKGHYVPQPMQAVHSFRPDNNAFRSDAQFDDHTMYRQDYTPKPIQLCEAAVIDQPTSRFRFSELDTRGHRMYQSTITPLQTQQRSLSQQRLGMSVA